MRLTEERSRDRGIEGTRMATNVTPILSIQSRPSFCKQV